MPEIIPVNLSFMSGAELLASGMRANALRTNTVLRDEEWKSLDESVLQIAQERLVGVADLLSRGLVFNIPNGMGTTVFEYEDISDALTASLSMDGLAKADNDRVDYTINALPLPILSADYRINARVLAASRNRGSALDTTMAMKAARAVAEKQEEFLFMGTSSYTYGGGTIYGYTDQPNRNTGTLNAAWNGSAATGATILADVLAMKQSSIDAKHYGPWVLYHPTAYETQLDEDFKANSDKSIRQRLMEVGGLSDIKVADKLTGNNVLLVEMHGDVARIIQAMPVTNVEWDAQGKMVFNFKVMTIAVAQIRADQEGNSGITHYNI